MARMELVIMATHLAHLQLVRVLRDGTDNRVVGRDEDEAALGNLVDALLRQVLARVTREFLADCRQEIATMSEYASAW